MDTQSRFGCKCGCGKINIHLDLVTLMETIEVKHGHKLTILSGYRCDEHNAKVGGVKNSTHTKGLACDFTTEHMDELDKWLSGHNGGYKYYKDKYFIHIDIDRRRRW